MILFSKGRRDIEQQPLGIVQHDNLPRYKSRPVGVTEDTCSLSTWHRTATFPRRVKRGLWPRVVEEEVTVSSGY